MANTYKRRGMKLWVKLLLVLLAGVAETCLICLFPEILILLMLILVGPITFLAGALKMGGDV